MPTQFLDIAKADNGEVVENTRVTELPLNGRDPGMLAILAPGAIWTGTPQYQRPFDDTQANISVTGGGTGNVALMVNGVSNNASPLNNNGQALISYVPPVDSVQEFKIVTNPYDAQYGLMAGGVEDVTLKQAPTGSTDLFTSMHAEPGSTLIPGKTTTSLRTPSHPAHLTIAQICTTYETPVMKWDQYGVESQWSGVNP